VLFAEVVDVAAGVFEDSQAEESEHRDECEVAAVGRLLRGSRQRLELQMSETKRRRFGWHVGSSGVLGRRVRQYAVDDTGSVEASGHRHAAQVRLCVDSRLALEASQVRHGQMDGGRPLS